MVIIQKKNLNITNKKLKRIIQMLQVNYQFYFIKLANITIKNGTVYLIDFGLLTKDKSEIGTYISMSYKSVIVF